MLIIKHIFWMTFLYNLNKYHNLFRLIGIDWLWFSRLLMSDEQLAEFLNEPTRDIFHTLC